MEVRSQLAQKFKKRHEARKANRVNWDSFWQDIARFCIPDKDDVFQFGNRATGDRKYHRLYDASAVHFNEMLANTLHSMMTNPSQVWFELNARDKKINENPAVRKWLQELAQKMIQILNNTNFQAQVHEVYMDLGSFGTSVMGIFEDDDYVMRFDSKPIYQFYPKENEDHIIDEISNVETMTVENAFNKYGKEAFGDEAEKLEKKPTDKIEILQIILPRKDAERVGVSQKSMAWASYHIYCDKDIILRESGFNEFPYVVPRWMKLSDEIYGRSPSMKALPDIKMLNAIMKTTIRAAQKVVDPPLLVPDDGVLGKINTTPGGVNTYRAGTDDKIMPLETRGNINIGVDLMKDVRERVKQHYFVDQFQLNIGPQMTATEVNARVEQQLRLLGPVLGRLHFEFLQPLVGRMLSIMQRKNLLPANPPAELTQGQFDVEVFFTSQIAKAQRSSEANNLINFIGTMQPIVELDPSAADAIDIIKTMRKIAILNGVSEDVLRDDDEVAEIQEKRAQLEAQQQQSETELMGAETLQKGVPAMRDMAQLEGGGAGG